MEELFQTVRWDDELTTYDSLIGKVDIDVVNEYNQNLLHEAIAYKKDSIGLDLIERGINVNLQDYNGQTPLHYAAAHDNEVLAEAIIKAGGNVNIKDKFQNNALWTAVFNAKGKYKIVEHYKRAGGDVGLKNLANRSPLDLAIQFNDEILAVILET